MDLPVKMPILDISPINMLCAASDFWQESTEHKKLILYWRNLLIFLVWKAREHLEGQRLLSENVTWREGGVWHC